MNIKIQSLHFDADTKLVAHIHDKVEKLLHFHSHILDAEVILKLEKSVNHENKIAEIKLNVPGKTLFSKERDKTFEHATDSAIEALRTQVVREKEKSRGL